MILTDHEWWLFGSAKGKWQQKLKFSVFGVWVAWNHVFTTAKFKCMMLDFQRPKRGWSYWENKISPDS